MSMTAREYLEDEAAAWWRDEVDCAWDSALNLRHAVGHADVAAGPPFMAGMAEVRWMLALACHLLKNPDSPVDDTWDEGPTALEGAQCALDKAWRILTTLMRRTRSLRDLMAFGLAASRVAVLRARIAHRSVAPSHTPHGRSRTGTVADVLRSLTQAAHAPPLVGAPSRPVIAGGGPL